MIIRVRSSAGTERFEVDDKTTLLDLKNKINSIWKFPNFTLSRQPDGKQSLGPDSAAVIKDLKFGHGDMLYLIGQELATTSMEESPVESIKEDEIDKYIEQQDGWIPRNRDPRLCQHVAHGRCQFCMPIPPWEILHHDPWKSDAVKFIPFHSYVRKIQTTSGCRHPENQKCLNCKSLDLPTYKVKACKKHPPWPEAICTECKPSACRIDSQVYRHIDSVEFESSGFVDKFVQYWRETGNQRCGFLYGRYVPDENVPLGITASVAAIYEPPQKNSRDQFTLEVDPNEEMVDQFAQLLGLQKIGFIWTDLITEKNSTKLVHNRKDIILTSQEILRTAKLQNSFPSPCKETLSGTLGSKFVSVLITCNEELQVDTSAFQVSDQCMNLVKDGIITASKDPKLMKVKHSSKRYIPDVMYSTKNEYGIEVVQKAEPTFPVDFFIIRSRVGAPKKPNPLFKMSQFPIENRGRAQFLTAVKSLLDSTSLINALSDFHFLVYLITNHFSPAEAQLLAQAFLKREESPELRAIFLNLLKQVPSSTPTTATAPTMIRPPTTAPTTASRPAPTKRELELEAQLVAMGYTPTQAREAGWATSYQGIEQAIEFLSKT